MHPLMIVMLPVMFPMSFVAYVSPFAWLRAIPLFAALAMMIALRKKDQLAVTRWAWWAMLTYFFDLVAWASSVRLLPESASSMHWASGTLSYSIAGFPLHLLELPPAAMGSDRPETSQWWIVMVNLTVWAFIAAAIVGTPKIAAKLRMNGLWPWIGALLLHQYTLFMFMIWFD